MQVNDFLNVELLGNRFFAGKGFTEALHRDTKKLVGYRINISIQDESSDFFMEMFSVKVSTTTPSISVEDMKNNKTREVILKDLQVGQFNGKLWFTASDILPVGTK